MKHQRPSPLRRASARTSGPLPARHRTLPRWVRRSPILWIGIALVVMTVVGMALGNVFEIHHYGSSL